MAPPFMNSTGLVTKILEKIIAAQQPDRFTQDFLKTKLGYSSGSAMPFIGLLKRLGFIQSDGTPTPLYGKFRNRDSRGKAMAEAMRQGYKEVFERNESAHKLDSKALKNLVIEITGAEATSSTVAGIVGTFLALKAFANFDADLASEAETTGKKVTVLRKEEDLPPSPPSGLNLSYTINLNLPETTEVEVFNAIFRSLKENLLR